MPKQGVVERGPAPHETVPGRVQDRGDDPMRPCHRAAFDSSARDIQSDALSHAQRSTMTSYFGACVHDSMRNEEQRVEYSFVGTQPRSESSRVTPRMSHTDTLDCYVVPHTCVVACLKRRRLVVTGSGARARIKKSIMRAPTCWPTVPARNPLHFPIPIYYTTSTVLTFYAHLQAARARQADCNWVRSWRSAQSPRPRFSFDML